MNIFSLSTLKFGTSYVLGNLSVVDGSVSYLYSSLLLTNVMKSAEVDLHDTTGYWRVCKLEPADSKTTLEVWLSGNKVDGRSRR